MKKHIFAILGIFGGTGIATTIMAWGATTMWQVAAAVVTAMVVGWLMGAIAMLEVTKRLEEATTESSATERHTSARAGRVAIEQRIVVG